MALGAIRGIPLSALKVYTVGCMGGGDTFGSGVHIETPYGNWYGRHFMDSNLLTRLLNSSSILRDSRVLYSTLGYDKPEYYVS
ncbi:hypothetical protein TNCV_3491891 [Trichonephila clavipes]|nr:hypothetical protein TNCV_3491891 [Trichonephila clavipes]